MRRVIVSLMVMAAGLLTACTETEEVISRAELEGTFDLALVGDLLFVTSTDRDELRALDLSQDADRRDFVRAPNPLEPLSIPVLQRPQALARDVRYQDGHEVTGPYLYARSAGVLELSIVAADRSILREVGRLSTAGPVTAFAGRGPTSAGAPSTLYFATREASGGQLWQVELPGPEALMASGVPTPVPLPGAVPAGEAVSALLVLPEPGHVAVATRSAGGRAGQTFRLNVQTGEKVPLQFGAPVLQLATHGRVGDSLAAGARIFGILDKSFCGGRSECSGVLAVDAATGALAKDNTGYPMLPIYQGLGLPTGLTLAPGADLLLQVGSTRSVEDIPLLGIVPISSGEILLFDALELHLFDIKDDAAAAEVTLVDAQGNAKETGNVVSVEVTEGATRDAIYQLVYQAALPGLARVPRTPGTSGRFEVPAGTHIFVQQNDAIVLLPDGDGAPCATDLRVSAVEPPASAGAPAVLVTDTPIPAECANFPSLEVRAMGDQPFVLASTLHGFVRRFGVGEAYELRAPYYFHPSGYKGQTEAVALRLSLQGLSRGLVRNDRYVVNVKSNYLPFSIAVDTSSQSPLVSYRVPGSVVRAEVQDTDYAYVAYPSADGILQVNLEAISAEGPNLRGLVNFE